MPQQVISPLVHCKSMLGDSDNRSTQVDKKGTEGQTARCYPVVYMRRHVESDSKKNESVIWGRIPTSGVQGVYQYPAYDHKYDHEIVLKWLAEID